MATATLPNASTPSPQLHIEISAKSCIENDNLEPKFMASTKLSINLLYPILRTKKAMPILN